MSTSRTVAAVLTFRRPRLATSSVRYLLEAEGLAADDVMVVVNGEGGLDDQQLADRVTVVRLATNLGPAGGMRACLEHATADPSVDWVYLCEDDIGVSGLPSPRLGQLRSMAADHEAATGRPIGAIVAYSRRLDRRTGLTTPHIPTGDGDGGAGGGDGLVATDVASWGATLVSRRVVDAGVLPRGELFFGYEDFDFFLALHEAGFDVVLDRACARQLGRTVHPSGREATLGAERTVDDTEPWRRYYEARNFLHLARRHGHPGWTAAHLAKSLRRAGMGSGAHRRAIAAGLVDGFRRRTGPNPRYLRHDDERPATTTTEERSR